MATLSTDQIRTLLTTAGFPKNSTVTDDMVGIAYAESGGDPNSHNSKPPDDSYGLWQINMLGSLGPARRKQFGISTNTQLFDPQTNARAAYVVYKSQGLNAWTTYKNGEYLKYMNGKTSATGDVGSAVSNLTSFSGISSSINAVGQNLFKGVADFTGILIALALLAMGIIVLIADSKGVKNTAKGVAKIATVAA